MMLLYKAWRESRVRFGIMAAALIWACGVVILMQQAMRTQADEPMTYVTFIWKAVYKGAVRDLFAILVMMLGLGGLLQERAAGTVGFTLALPVSRSRLVVTRAGVGFLEVALLAFLPAILLPVLSPLAGQSYPLSQSLQFGLLWTGGGAILFAVTFFFSALLAGEYLPWVLCIAAVTIYAFLIHVPALAGFPQLDFLGMMNGADMPWFRSTDSMLIGPFPWPALLVMLLLAFAFAWGHAGVTARRDFS
jgi:ABC-2 type transport system permease protein